MLGNQQDTIKQPNVRIIGVPEGVGKEEGLEGLLNEIITETFPNLEKERDFQVQEIHRTPNRHKHPRCSQHTSVKFPIVKYKEKILKCA